MKNKSIIIIISTILVLTIAGVGLYFVQKRNNIKNYVGKNEINNNEEKIEENIQVNQENIDLGNVDTSEWKIYRNEELGFEIAFPEEVFDKKFEIYTKDKDIIRFYDIGCEYNGIGMPASDCVNINIHKKKLDSFTENDKNIYNTNFNKNNMLNGREFVMKMDERYIENNKIIYGANTIVKDDESYYFIGIGGVYFDFNSDLITKYEALISTFKILE